VESHRQSQGKKEKISQAELAVIPEQLSFRLDCNGWYDSMPDLRGQFVRGLNSFGSAAGTRADGNQDPNGEGEPWATIRRMRFRGKGFLIG
jgi:hypothetical protein